MKKRSKFRTLDPGSVWHYFSPNPKDECAAICRTCGKSISYFYDGNDKGALRKHLKRKHNESYDQMNRIQDEWFSQRQLKRKLNLKKNLQLQNLKRYFCYTKFEIQRHFFDIRSNV